MKLIIAGTGPGDTELITVKAVNAARSADVIIVPRSHDGKEGVAERVIKHYVPDKPLILLTFPMNYGYSHDLASQLEGLNLADKTVFFPVLGDAVMYSTGAYLIEALSEVYGDVSVEFVPGISAHSAGAGCAGKFLVMRDEVLTIIPATTSRVKFESAIKACDCAAIYKPSAMSFDLAEVIDVKDYEIVRVDYAGIEGLEKVTRGPEALNYKRDYLSIILLWRR